MYAIKKNAFPDLSVDYLFAEEKEVGQRVNIEAERERLGLSKSEFAKKLGIALKTYYNWINGDFPIPSDALILMSELCDASIDYLLGLSDVRRKGA